MPTGTGAEWAGHTDEALLGALAARNPDALLELHRRYAPHLYALAGREYLPDPERRVQDAWLFILRHAHDHARSSLDARRWLLLMAHRSLTEPEREAAPTVRR